MRFSTGEVQSFPFGSDFFWIGVCGKFKSDQNNFVDIETTSDGLYLRQLSGVLEDGFGTEETNDRFKLQHVEVNQVIQDMKSGIPILRGKRTLVRPHIQGNGKSVATVRIHGRTLLNNKPLPDSPLPYRSYVPGKNTLKDRHDGNGISWALPLSWTTNGDTVLLEVEGNGVEAGASPLFVPIHFVKGPSLHLDVSYWIPTDLPKKLPEIASINGGSLAEFERQLRAILPVSRLSVKMQPRQFPSEWLTNPKRKLSLLDLILNFQSKNVLQSKPSAYPHYSLIPVELERPELLPDKGGETIPKQSLSVAYMYPKEFADVDPRLRTLHVHEISHQYSLEHIQGPEILCNKPAPPPPYELFPAINVSGGVPTIGPHPVPSSAEIQGVSWHASESSALKLNDILVRSDVPDIMSYCSDGKFGRWISDFSYLNLLTNPATSAI